MQIVHVMHEEEVGTTLASICQPSLNAKSGQNYYPLDENKTQI